LGSIWVHNLHGWLIGKGPGQGNGIWRQRSLNVQGSNNCFRLSALETGCLAKTEICLAEENNPLFLMETFIRLNFLSG
jgi:hypothetical protein